MAVMLDAYDDPKGTARLVLLYFPSWRSAAKDKPYLDDVMNKLQHEPLDAAKERPSVGDTTSKLKHWLFGQPASAAQGASGSATSAK
jgi:hypothetical protein